MSNCFYEKGLSFECQGCSYCCSAEPGYVFLSSQDIDKLSTHLGLTKSKFIETYCRYVNMGNFKMISLIEKDNYDCIFLSNKGCMVYESRPCQCATYPFWANIVESQEDWDNEAKSCPGINKGKLFTKKEIQEKLLARLANNPVIM